MRPCPLVRCTHSLSPLGSRRGQRSTGVGSFGASDGPRVERFLPVVVMGPDPESSPPLISPASSSGSVARRCGYSKESSVSSSEGGSTWFSVAKGTEPVEDECSASLPSATLGTTRYRFFIFNMDEAPLDRIDAAGQIFAECETQQTDAVFAEYRGGHSAKVSCHASSAHTTRLAECCTTRQTWWSTCRALERPTLPSTTAQDLGEDSHMSAPRHTRSPSPCVRHSAKLSAAWQPPSPSGPSSTFFCRVLCLALGEDFA